MMTEQQIADHLQFLLDQSADARKDEDWEEEMLGNKALGFEEAGVLSGNKGVLLRLEDGSEFQITVVKSK